jgi:hypothetical protein
MKEIKILIRGKEFDFFQRKEKSLKVTFHAL